MKKYIENRKQMSNTWTRSGVQITESSDASFLMAEMNGAKRRKET